MKEKNTIRQNYGISNLTAGLIFLVPFLITGFFTFIIYHWRTADFTQWLLSESRPVEWMQFACFLIASILGFRLAFYIKKNHQNKLVFWYYILFGFAAFFVAMEEVSWGQWLVGLEPPESIRAINKQEELNFHNIPGFYELFEVLRATFGLGGFILIGFFNHERLKLMGAASVLSSWFIIIFVLAGLDIFNQNKRGGNHLFLDWAFDMVEVLELLIALAILLYVWLNGRMAKNTVN